MLREKTGEEVNGERVKSFRSACGRIFYRFRIKFGMTFLSLVVVVVVFCFQRISKFLLRIKHLPTAVYIKKANAKLYAKNKTHFAKTIFLIDSIS